MRLFIALISLTSILMASCSSDSDTLAFELERMLKLKLESEKFKYRVEGNEVNQVGYFYSRKRIEGFNKMLISGCKSEWSHAPISFKVKFNYRGEGTIKTNEVLKKGVYSANSTENDLQIYFEFTDADGVNWSTYPRAREKNHSNAEIEILNVKPRYSPINGSRKNQVDMNFNATFFNAKNESLKINGFMTTVLDTSF